ncbi:hypothetical protein RN70_09950 [Staphylococcus schleiferi]|uniref:hypothetical protein n=1 Tax=Staphylococcus coagulans TaxID=74706 RepID=UPI00067A1B27|nr:hypothetical protein NP71_09675 [Staphylococcus schleiferi]AKS74198.1 hypothetical protein RN70_09950 [Staphylococcus schleiferi]
MKDSPNNRLTVKETWAEGQLEAKLSKEEKKYYRSLNIQDRRVIIQKFKDKEVFNVYDYQPQKKAEFTNIEKTLKKRNLENLSYETKQSLEANGVGKFIDDFFSRLSSTMTNPKNSGQMFTYELINQNFTLIKLLDDSLKQNEKLVQQNEEIISLLTQIANKGEL